MLNLKKIELNKIKSGLKKIPRALGEKTFQTFLVLLFITIILGVATLFKYNVDTENIIDVNRDEVLTFKEKSYQAIMDGLGEREKKFKETDLKGYPNPFKAW